MAYGLWVVRAGQSDDSGFWYNHEGHVWLSDTPEGSRAILARGYDNSFHYTPRAYTGPINKLPRMPMPPMAPGAEMAKGLRVKFRDDYDPRTGITAGPGDMFFVPCPAGHEGIPCSHWDNCDGQHLVVVTPDGRWWNVDARSRNCDQKGERTHRCWVRHGDPRDNAVTVDKDGTTCGAGGGSIDTGRYHGNLVDGVFNP